MCCFLLYSYSHHFDDLHILVVILGEDVFPSRVTICYNFLVVHGICPTSSNFLHTIVHHAFQMCKRFVSDMVLLQYSTGLVCLTKFLLPKNFKEHVMSFLRILK